LPNTGAKTRFINAQAAPNTPTICAAPASPCPVRLFTRVGNTGTITPIETVFIMMAA